MTSWKRAHSVHIYLINNPLTWTKVNDFKISFQVGSTKVVLLWFKLSSIYGDAGSLLNGYESGVKLVTLISFIIQINEDLVASLNSTFPSGAILPQKYLKISF